MPTIVLTPSTPVQRCHVWWYISLASKCFLLDIMFVLCAIFQDESSGAGSCSWDQLGLPGADWAPRSWFWDNFFLTNWLLPMKVRTRWWFQSKIFFGIFTLIYLGKMNPFWRAYFSDGWFETTNQRNNQPSKSHLSFNFFFWQDWYQILPPWLELALQFLKSRWHSPYILVYKDPFRYLPFGICAIYFDLQVTQFHEILQILPVISGFRIHTWHSQLPVILLWFGSSGLRRLRGCETWKLLWSYMLGDGKHVVTLPEINSKSP